MVRNSYRNLCLGTLVGFAAFSAEAGDNAGLLKKLVEKGIISEGEAAVLAEEANSEFNNSMPSWVNSLTLKGDLRLRCLLYTSPSPRDKRQSRMPSSA